MNEQNVCFQFDPEKITLKLRGQKPCYFILFYTSTFVYFLMTSNFLVILLVCLLFYSTCHVMITDCVDILVTHPQTDYIKNIYIQGTVRIC